MQVVVNAEGEVLSFNDKLLIGASTLPVEEVVKTIHDLNGLAIASHIDREGFSLIGQLGFIPEGLDLDALEISPAISFEEARQRYSPPYPLTCASDAHFIDDIGRGYTSFYIEEGTTEEIKKALMNTDGRKIIH
jgi:PHP family Zn ribbon phosphoesterase